MAVNNRDAAPSTIARYEALIHVSEALRTYREREALFRSLARELRPVVEFSFLGLALYDEQTQVVEPHVLEATGELVPPPLLTSGEQLTYWVIRHQKPLVIPSIEDETRFAQEMAYLRRQGTSSVCCLPLTTPQGRVGMLLVGSRRPHVYLDDEIAFLALVANQVALAIDDTLNHDALQASLAVERQRLQHLELLDGLLNALSGVLDVRHVFKQVSEVARKVIAHDIVSLLLVTGDTDHVLVYAISGSEVPLPTTFVVPEHQKTLLTESWEYVIHPDLQADPLEKTQPPAAQAGCRSRLLVPVRIQGEFVGALDFLSLQPDHYTKADVLVARRIADHVALALSHQRLADEVRRHEELRARTTNLDLLDELLAALIDSGDLREVFGRISTIASRVLAHDAALLMVQLPDGRRARVYASRGMLGNLPEVTQVPPELLERPDWEYDIFDDLSDYPLYALLVSMGYHSLLRVPIRFDGVGSSRVDLQACKLEYSIVSPK